MGGVPDTGAAAAAAAVAAAASAIAMEHGQGNVDHCDEEDGDAETGPGCDVIFN